MSVGVAAGAALTAWAAGEILFVMQTEGGIASHVPVEFVARRDMAVSAANNR